MHELLHLPFYHWEIYHNERPLNGVERLAYGQHNRQYALVVHPKQTPKGWIVYWHGGAWQFGNPEMFLKTANLWPTLGFGVILPSYRRVLKHCFSGIKADTISVFQQLAPLWESTNIPVFLLGMSAGGHLASWSALDTQTRMAAKWSEGQLRGLIACSAVTDLNQMKNNLLVRRLAGHPQQATFAQANPATLPHSQAPPCLLVHGTHDGMVPYRVAKSFQGAYQQATNETHCQLITIEKGSHLDGGRWMIEANSVQQQILMWINGYLTI